MPKAEGGPASVQQWQNREDSVVQWVLAVLLAFVAVCIVCVLCNILLGWPLAGLLLGLAIYAYAGK